MGKKKNSVKHKNRKMMEKKLKKAKRVNPSVSKKDAKSLNKVLEKNSEIPELKKIRKKCNHNLKKSTAFVSASEYNKDNMYLVKNLDRMKELFGEENVGICTTCLTAVPNMTVLTTDDVENTAIILSGAVEHIVNNTSSDKEIEEFHKELNDAIDFIRVVAKKYSKIRNKAGYDGEESKDRMPAVKSGIDYSKITQ